MAAFPTLSQNPDAAGYKEQSPIDPTIRTEMESGHIVTRSRFTIAPRKWSFGYSNLSNTDKDSIVTFERVTVLYGAEEFTWTNPINSTSYTVRLAKPIEYMLTSNLNNTWHVKLEFIEVVPTS